MAAPAHAMPDDINHRLHPRTLSHTLSTTDSASKRQWPPPSSHSLDKWQRLKVHPLATPRDGLYGLQHSKYYVYIHFFIFSYFMCSYEDTYPGTRCINPVGDTDSGDTAIRARWNKFFCFWLFSFHSFCILIPFSCPRPLPFVYEIKSIFFSSLDNYILVLFILFIVFHHHHQAANLIIICLLTSYLSM